MSTCRKEDVLENYKEGGIKCENCGYKKHCIGLALEVLAIEKEEEGISIWNEEEIYP